MTVYNINLQPQCLPRLGLTLENKLRVHAASLCVTLRRFTDSILKTAYTSAFNTKTSLQLHHVAVHGIVKTFFFFFRFGVQKQTGRERAPIVYAFWL